MGYSSDAWRGDLTKKGDVTSKLKDQHDLHGDWGELKWLGRSLGLVGKAWMLGGQWSRQNPEQSSLLAGGP